MFPSKHASKSGVSRRDWLRLASLGAFGASLSRWFPVLADEAAANPERKRSCILLWMTGGPSQTDTFDMKPGHDNGGEFQPIDTSVPGLQFSEHLPGLAKVAKHVLPIRSMSTKEGDHSRATFLGRTGYRPLGPVQYPAMGSALSKELGRDDSELPNYVSISPYRFFSPAAYGPGFLGPQFSPLVVGGQGVPIVQNDENRDYSNDLKVQDLDLPAGIVPAQADSRIGLLKGLDEQFASERPGFSPTSHQDAYRKAVRMMRSEAVKAFDLDEEPAKLRDAYGQNLFGQSCLLARRLIERDVPFVEVSLSRVNGNTGFGWDTHGQNFTALKNLCGVLDPGWSTLISDLEDRGLLDSTLIIWMGEFGRTPKINGNSGRDHYPNAWTTVLCGGGVKGGQAYGKTSDDGLRVEEGKATMADFMATVARALGLDPMKQNMSNVGRPIRLADPEGGPIQEILA